MQDIVYILFLFAAGACVGSFLNVVVWRLPRGESLVSPPSHCPKCQHRLAWYDNLPVIGWILLRGKCRYCGQGISMRYPLVEAATGALFVFYYVMFFMMQQGPEAARPLSLAHDWPIYGLYMFLISGLLACSLIDAELFIIPIEIPLLLALVGIVFHAIMDMPLTPGALNASAPAGALSAGAGLGLVISIAFWLIGWMPTSFPQGEPLLEVDRDMLAKEIAEAKREGKEVPPLPPEYSRAQVRAEMQKEMLFLFPPLMLGTVWLLLCTHVRPVREMWQIVIGYHWFSGLLGAVLGAMVGGFVVWLTRILGTLALGRVAMGLGDVHLMFGVGAIIGAAGATIAFFLAPFFGLLIALYMLLTGTRRELPYGPYLSLATACVLLLYTPIANYMAPGVQGLIWFVHQWFGGA